MSSPTHTPRRVRVASPNETAFPLTSIALLLIAVAVLLRAWVAFGSWFYEDDFYFLSRIATGDNDLQWYFTRHNVHFMPVGLFLATLVGWAGQFAWWAAALEISVLFLGSALACWWMLVRVFGQNPRILAPLTFYLFSPLLVPAITWWAAAINLVAVQIPLFILIGSHVEFLRTRRRRWLVLATVMLALIAGIYAKALVVTAVMGLFTYCYASTEPHLLRRLWQVVSRYWRIWTAYTVVGALVAIVYLRDSAGSAGGGDSASVDSLVENLVVRNLVPGLFGGPWTWADYGGAPRQLAAPSDVATVIALTLLIGAVAYAIHRWQNAWLPIVFLAPAFIATFASMAAFRTSVYPFLTLEPRYWSDSLPYFTLALGVTLMPVIGLPEVRRRRDNAGQTPTTQVAVALAGLYVASSLLTTVRYVEPWHGDFPARTFVTGAIASAKDEGPPITVADVPAPESAMAATLFPYNTPDWLFAPAPGLIAGTAAGVDVNVLDPWGVPQPAQARADLSADLSSDRCIRTTGSLGLPSRTLDYPFWATVAASFDRPTTVSIRAGQALHSFEVPRGRHLLTFQTRGSFDRLWVRLENTSRMCPESVAVGAGVDPS